MQSLYIVIGDMFSNTESTRNTIDWLGPKDVLIESLVDQLIVTNRRLMKEVDELKTVLQAEKLGKELNELKFEVQKAKHQPNPTKVEDELKINKAIVQNETKKLIREFSPTYRR